MNDNFQVEDWLTKELGRRPTMEERFERIRLAARRMGIPEPEPEPELTDEELARIAESARLLKTIPRRKVKKDSVELLREMRGRDSAKIADDGSGSSVICVIFLG